MTEDTEEGWFRDLPPDDDRAAEAAIREGTATEPREWSSAAVEAGVVDSAEAYYEMLHEATIAATRAAVGEAETADDQQLIHAVRAMDDIGRNRTTEPSRRDPRPDREYR